MSPNLEVTSRIPTSAVPKTLARTLKAILNPPPAMVRTISIAANNPLNVRFSLSAVSSLIIKNAVSL